MKKKHLIAIIFMASLLIICKIIKENHNKAFSKQFEKFVSTPIKIPYDMLDKKICYAFMDSLDKDIRLVFFLDSIGCLDCRITETVAYAKKNIDISRKVSYVYLFPIKSKDSEMFYRKLCRQRVEGEVFFDTCNAFMTANPDFPSNNIFHAFALDKNNNIIFVGNPANNPQNEKVFKKIVNNYPFGN